MTDRPTTAGGLELPFTVVDGLVALLLPFVVSFGLAWAGVDVGGRLDDWIWPLLLVAYLLARKRFDIRSIIGRRVGAGEWMLGVGVGAAVTLLGGAVVLVQRLIVGYEHPIYPIWTVFEPLIEVPLLPLLWSVAFVPVVEEVAFRSVGYRGLVCRSNILIASIVASGWFAALHYSGNVSFVARTFVFSMLMIWLIHKTRSLWPAISAHATHNTLVVVFGAIEADIVGWGRTLT